MIKLEILLEFPKDLVKAKGFDIVYRLVPKADTD